MKPSLFLLLSAVFSACSSKPNTVALPDDAMPPSVADLGEPCSEHEDCEELCDSAKECGPFWGHDYVVRVLSLSIPEDSEWDSDGSPPDVGCSWTDTAAGREIGGTEAIENSFAPEFDSGEIIELHEGVHLAFRCFEVDTIGDEPSRDVGEYCWEVEGKCSSVPEEVLIAGGGTVTLTGGPVENVQLTIEISAWD